MVGKGKRAVVKDGILKTLEKYVASYWSSEHSVFYQTNNVRTVAAKMYCEGLSLQILILNWLWLKNCYVLKFARNIEPDAACPRKFVRFNLFCFDL